jgi:TonB family protein
VNDALDRLIAERQALDHGMSRSFMVSLGAHGFLAAVAVAVTLLAPRQPPIQIMDGFVVPLPAGGGGTPNPQPPAAAAQPAPAPSAAPPVTAPPAPQVEEPPKVLKPPKEEVPKNRLPELDAKKVKAKPEKTPPPRVIPQPGETGRAAGGVSGGTGRSSQTPGLEFGPPGPGVPGGTDPNGDWYLAGVQRKIWMIWTQQIKADFKQPITVSFTILTDGSVEDVRVVQPSGVTLLDLAAQRAIVSAQPFGPLPKHYATNRYTIQAVFKPTP